MKSWNQLNRRRAGNLRVLQCVGAAFAVLCAAFAIKTGDATAETDQIAPESRWYDGGLVLTNLTGIFMTNAAPAMSSTYGLAWTGVTNGWDVVNLLESMDSAQLTSNVVAALAARGDICRVLGHHWRTGRPGEGFLESGESGMISLYADYHPDRAYRTCRTCGVVQTKITRDWQ